MPQSQLPETVIPVLEGVRERWFTPDTPLDFWTVADGSKLYNGFADLAAHLYLDGVLVEGLRPGWGMIYVLFEWETSLQFDGWTPLYEISDDHFALLCEMYAVVGLEKEAEALGRARAVAESSEDLGAVSAAYNRERHEYSGDLERAEYLARWFCDHADDLLYDRPDHRKPR